MTRAHGGTTITTFAIGITSLIVVVDDEDARVPVLNQGVYRAAFRPPVGDEV